MQFSALWLLLSIQTLRVKSEAQTINFPSQHELCAPRYQKNHILKVGRNVTEFFEKIKTFLTAKDQCITESRGECQYLVKGKLSYAKKQCLSDGGNVFSPTTKELTDLSNMPDFKNKTFVFKFKIGRVNNSAVRFAYSSDSDDPEALPVNLNVGSQNLNYAPVKFGYITTFRLLRGLGPPKGSQQQGAVESQGSGDTLNRDIVLWEILNGPLCLTNNELTLYCGTP